MIKAFLSHSSKDKQDYIRKVAEYLGRDNIVFDEWTFEEGELTLDEILESLDKTALFVIFISKNSLESEWVRKEINEAKVRLDESRIQKIFPIVIDDQISHDNELIPDWLVKNYNLRPIKRAHVAAKRIQNKLRELSWTRHPELKKRHSMFVGRNDKQEEFETRIHDFDKNKPIVIIATGLAGVGRRTFLHRALYKTNIIESPHKPSSIFLDNNVSIEDFILKLNDLGFVDFGEKITDLSNKTISQKISIIHEIMEAVYDNKEVVYIYDDGCLINYQREVTEWFKKVIDDFDKCNFPIFAIASKYKVNFKYRPRGDSFYFVDLNELNPNERRRLFIQLLELYKVSMAKDNFDDVCDLLFGLPDQIMFAVDLIKEDSGKFVDKLPILAEFNTDKASVLLKKYEFDEVSLNFIRLLAQFEIISSNFIFSIVDESEHYSVLESLVAENICELIGIDEEIIRLNDVIRDYIKRNRIKLSKEHQTRLDEKVKAIIQDDEVLERDSSEYIFSIKEALKKGIDIREDLLIPSHYLRCMKDLYYTKGSLDRIIELADIILQKSDFLDYRVKNDIQYYLCLALAKQKSTRLLSEVQKIKGDEHNFLLGFYYRLSGRYKEALERFEPIKDAAYVGARSKREIVQVYVQLEDYSKALEYAKRNFDENRGNQFHTQAYFNCLINSENAIEHKSILLGLINNLKVIDSEQSNEMADIAQALFESKINNDQEKAYDLINDTVYKYPESHYPLLTLCDIAIKNENIALLQSGMSKIELLAKSKPISIRTFKRYQAFFKALNGDIDAALSTLDSELSKYPQDSRDRIVNKLKEISLRHNNKF